MTTIHIVILALVQGITEFLPVSSAGHLILVPHLFNWADQGLIVDVAVHVGTLGAVVLYLWSDVWRMATGLGRFVQGRKNADATLAFYVIAATIPVVIAGFVLKRYYPDGIRDLAVVGWATFGYGVLLWIADQIGMTVRRIEHIRIWDVLFIGMAQVLALVPGTSRSGITMTAARLIGMERPDAARFSMILSIPTIIGAGVLEGWELIKLGDAELTSDVFLAALLAFVAAILTIIVMMAWLRRASFTPFVIYRIGLGLFIVALAYGYV
ncbi:MAG: undecaprenyl-diphosphate phosphatase [Rhodospirillales bacterium]|nr:undecaprenyl-diphosphate phosphatase [Rhodospirillales bacterium]